MHKSHFQGASVSTQTWPLTLKQALDLTVLVGVMRGGEGRDRVKSSTPSNLLLGTDGPGGFCSL